MNNPYYINTGLGNIYKSGGSFKKYKKAVKKLYDTYLWGSPETKLTKREYKKHKKDLWEGLNQSKEVLTSLNKEKLKHPTDKQLVESYNNDNEIPLDYNYNVFNTARRDREQALLDAYNYNQSLLTPAQREANRVASREDYRGLSYLLNGMALSPFILSGAGLNLTKGLYNLLNNPVVDLALTAHGAIKAPSNIKEGIKSIREGDTGKGVSDLGFTALDMLGAGRLAKRIAPSVVNLSKNMPYIFKSLPETDVLPGAFEALRKAHASNQSVHPNIYRYIPPGQRLAGRSVFDSVRRPEVHYSLNPSMLFDSIATYGNNKVKISPRLLFKERNVIGDALPHEYEHYFQKYHSPQLSISGNNYWVFNPRHPLRDTLSLFDKKLGPLGKRKKWVKSPDELDAEMVQWKHDMSIPFSKKYLDFESDLQDEFINKTMDEFNLDKEDVQKILLDLSGAGYFANGGKLDGGPQKPPVNVDLDYMWNSNQKLGNNRMMNRGNMEQLDNFFIEKGLSLPQRQALLYTILQESGADSLGAHGNGYYGLVGWSPERYNVIKDKSLMGQAEHLYNTLFNGNGKVDWNHGGDGSGYASWTDARKAFLNAQDFDTAMRALTYGYVRPSDENKLYRIEYGPKHFVAPVSEEQTPVVLDLNTKEGFDNPELLKKINKDMNEYSNGGTIHIKPENKGKFTAAAKRAGKSVQGYASQILANPDNYSSTLVKRANFAHNAAKWHADGGPIDGWDPTLKKRYPPLEEVGNDVNKARAYSLAKLNWEVQHPGEPYPSFFHQRLDAYVKEKSDEMNAKAIKRTEKMHNALKNSISKAADWVYDKYYNITNNAYGGTLYPNGGPIDPPWANFVPSQPKEPQVVKPQPQVNPYLLGLSAGRSQNEAAKYSSVANTPEFQEGYDLGVVQAAVEKARAEHPYNTPVIEPGIDMVSPLLDLSPVGDVRALVDAGEYYQATGDLKTALGLAALGVVAVPGAGRAAGRAGVEFLDDAASKEVQQFVKNREMLNGALESMKNYGRKDIPKPTGTLNYNIPAPEPMRGFNIPIPEPIAQTHPIFDNPGNRIKREPRKSRYNLSDIDMSYMTNSQKEAVKPLILGRREGKKWVNTNKENLFRGKSAAERAEIVAKELENMRSNTTSIPNTTQGIGNNKKGLKKVGQWMKDNPWKTSAIFAIPTFLGTMPFWDDIGNKVELSNQRKKNPGIVINPEDTVYQNTNANTASDIDTTSDKYAANRALVENMAALDHDEIEWGRRQLDSILNTKHTPMDSLIWENWVRQAIEDSAARQNNYRR